MTEKAGFDTYVEEKFSFQCFSKPYFILYRCYANIIRAILNLIVLSYKLLFELRSDAYTKSYRFNIFVISMLTATAGVVTAR